MPMMYCSKLQYQNKSMAVHFAIIFVSCPLNSLCINVSYQNVQNTVYVLRNRLAKQLVLLYLENSLQDFKRPSHPSLFVLIII